jgi:hypothetical protein
MVFAKILFVWEIPRSLFDYVNLLRTRWVQVLNVVQSMQNKALIEQKAVAHDSLWQTVLRAYLSETFKGAVNGVKPCSNTQCWLLLTVTIDFSGTKP